MSHPYLFAGFNTAPNNGDEVDGAGVNYPPVSPHWVNTMTRIEILIITDEMLAIFDNGCPDLVIRHQPNSVTIRGELETLEIRRKAAA